MKIEIDAVVLNGIDKDSIITDKIKEKGSIVVRNYNFKEKIMNVEQYFQIIKDFNEIGIDIDKILFIDKNIKNCDKSRKFGFKIITKSNWRKLKWKKFI